MVHDAASTTLCDAGSTLMALLPLVGALGNMDRPARHGLCLHARLCRQGGCARDSSRGPRPAGRSIDDSDLSRRGRGTLRTVLGLPRTLAAAWQKAPGDDGAGALGTEAALRPVQRGDQGARRGVEGRRPPGRGGVRTPGSPTSSPASTLRLPAGLGAGIASGAAATVSGGGRAGVTASATSTPATAGSAVRQG